MLKNYKKILSFMTSAGERLIKKSGNINDIGITKKYLTKEDLKIERELKNIISDFGKEFGFYAEEENSGTSEKSKNVWIVDPISNTGSFILGLPHYAIVVSHLVNGKNAFAAVYDPSVKEMFTAYRNKGAYLNGKRILVSKKTQDHLRIVYNLSRERENETKAKKIFSDFSRFAIFRNTNSSALNFCYVACGRFDGVISLVKDSFTEFAGSLLIKEAGGVFTSLNRRKKKQTSQRVSIGGNPFAHKILVKEIKEIFT